MGTTGPAQATRATLWLMPKRRLSLLAVIALALAGCGTNSHSTAATSSSSADSAWLAGRLPAGFVIISAEEKGGRRSVGYAPTSARQQIYDYQIAITASAPGTALPLNGRNSRNIQIRDHQATLVTLTDEGRDYGAAVAWDERPDLRIVVEGSNGPSEQETLAVAEDVHGISDADWQTLVVELSPDTHVGRVDHNARPVEALRGTKNGSGYVLTALVPGGYPLGREDRRLDCFRLSFRSETTKDYCPAHPIWARVGGQLFVFGDVPTSVRRVRVSGIYGSTFEPFTVDTVALSTGPPTSFYVAPLPEGTCAVSVDNADGAGGRGTTGPLIDDGADYSRCSGGAPGPRPSPPTTVG